MFFMIFIIMTFSLTIRIPRSRVFSGHLDQAETGGNSLAHLNEYGLVETDK